MLQNQEQVGYGSEFMAAEIRPQRNQLIHGMSRSGSSGNIPFRYIPQRKPRMFQTS